MPSFRPLSVAGWILGIADFAIHDRLVGVGEVVAGADVPLAAALRGQVRGERPCLGGLHDLVGGVHRFVGHDIVVDHQLEVRTGGHPIDQAPGLDRRLLRIAAPSHHQRTLGPLRGLLWGVTPQDLRESPLQQLVALQFLFDLQQELGGRALGMAEDPDRDLRVEQDLLDDAGEGDDGGLVVLARPHVDVAVRVCLHLPAALVDPVVQAIGAAEEPDQQVVPVSLCQPADGRPVLEVLVLPHPLPDQDRDRHQRGHLALWACQSA